MSDFEMKMRQMALLEYRADHDVKITTKNIRNVFGFYSIEPAEVRTWFTMFEGAKEAKFENDEERDASILENFPNGFPQVINSMISQFKAGRFFRTMKTYDGRIGFGIGQKKFVVCDLFHGEFRSIPLPLIRNLDDYSFAGFVDDDHFFVSHAYRRQLTLFKLDVGELTVEQIDVSQNDNLTRNVFLDDLGSKSFFVRKWNSYCTGNVVDNRIVMSEVSAYEKALDNLSLRGSEVWGLRRVNASTCQFFKLNLETRTETTVDIPTVLDNGQEFDLNDYYTGEFSYFWAERTFYIARGASEDASKIYALNLDTREWTDTGIEILNHVHRIYVDHNGILTAITQAGSVNTIVYRFPLHRPDTLVNLSWFSMSREKKKTGKRGYKKFFKRLPFTCDIHLQLTGAQQADTTQDE